LSITGARTVGGGRKNLLGIGHFPSFSIGHFSFGAEQVYSGFQNSKPAQKNGK
jgi:hypothetical protein